MEHAPTDTPIRSKTAEPPASSQQSPPTALPSPGERGSPISLFGGIMDAASAKLRDVAMVALFRGPYNVVVGGDRDGGGAEALAMGTAGTRQERVAAGEEAGKSGDGVEGASAKGKGPQASVGTWGGEMEELAAEVVRSLEERRGVMEQLEELRKKEERLAAEDEELSKEFDMVVDEAERQETDSLWDELRRIRDRIEEIDEEQEVIEVEVERVGKLFDSMEREAEELVVTLAARVIDGRQWMGTGARRSVAVAGGAEAGVKVEVDDVKVGTGCAEDAARN